MKKVIYLLLIGGAIFICPHQSKAEPYYLARSLIIIIKAFHQTARLQPALCALTLQLMSLLYRNN